MNLSELSENTAPSKEEVYHTLLRSLRRRKGFGIVFVQCSPAEAAKLIQDIQKDLPQKQVGNLKFDEPIDNLYDLVAELPDREDLNIVFIEGLEKSLEPYIKPGYGGDGDYYNLDTVPTILGHLNQRREIFRDHFKNICFVFFLPLFAVKYIIRRAPDFYDWSAGVFEFTTEADIQKEDLAQYKRVGFQYRRQKQYDQAIEVYQQALLISREMGDLRNEVDILDSLGAAHFRLRQYEDAIRFYQQSLIIAQDIKDREGESNALYFIGDSYYYLGQYEQAIKFTQQSLALARELNNYQGESIALHNIGFAYYNLKQYPQAIECFQKSLTIKQEIDNPQSESVTLNSLGRVHNTLGQDKQAINYYRKQLDVAYKIDSHKTRNTTTMNALRCLGNTCERLGNYEEAISYYDKALEISLDNYWVWFDKARILSRMGRSEEAISSYEKVLEIKPDHSISHHSRALALAGIGCYEESIQGFRKAIELRPDNATSWMCLGGSLRSLRRYEESLACFDKAAELEYAWKAFELSGRVIPLLRLGRFKEAFISGYKFLLVFKAEWGVREWVERRVAVTLTRLGLQKLVPVWTKFLQLIGWRVKDW